MLGLKTWLQTQTQNFSPKQICRVANIYFCFMGFGLTSERAGLTVTATAGLRAFRTASTNSQNFSNSFGFKIDHVRS